MVPLEELSRLLFAIQIRWYTGFATCNHVGRTCLHFTPPCTTCPKPPQRPKTIPPSPHRLQKNGGLHPHGAANSMAFIPCGSLGVSASSHFWIQGNHLRRAQFDTLSRQSRRLLLTSILVYIYIYTCTVNMKVNCTGRCWSTLRMLLGPKKRGMCPNKA